MGRDTLQLGQNTVSKATDKALCQYLLSPYRDLSIRTYKQVHRLTFPEASKSVSNRILRLKLLKEVNPSAFLEHCGRHSLIAPVADSIDSCQTDSDDESNSDCHRDSASDNEAESGTNTMNEYGEKIVLCLPGGIIFCAIWTHIMLDPDRLKIEIAKDGCSVIKKEAMPEPDDEDLLKSFDWNNDDRHFVVKHVKDEVERMRRALKDGVKWKESTVIALKKEVFRHFVDCYGNASNDVYSDYDTERRQRIIFFLKTVDSEAAPRPASIVTSPSTRVASPSTRVPSPVTRGNPPHTPTTSNPVRGSVPLYASASASLRNQFEGSRKRHASDLSGIFDDNDDYGYMEADNDIDDKVYRLDNQIKSLKESLEQRDRQNLDAMSKLEAMMQRALSVAHFPVQASGFSEPPSQIVEQDTASL